MRRDVVCCREIIEGQSLEFQQKTPHGRLSSCKSCHFTLLGSLPSYLDYLDGCHCLHAGSGHFRCWPVRAESVGELTNRLSMDDGATGCVLVCPNMGTPTSYPLVNIQKTMENHHFSWENPRSITIFNSYVKLPEGNSETHIFQKLMLFCKRLPSLTNPTNPLNDGF